MKRVDRHHVVNLVDAKTVAADGSYTSSRGLTVTMRTYTPVLIDAGFPELDIPVPWWGGRSLRFGFPPR
jgi:hypothetical protein